MPPPDNFNDFVPDVETILKLADRNLAEKKYREAMLRTEPVEEQATFGSPPSAPDAAEKAPRIVLEPPPATVTIPKRTVRVPMPLWKWAVVVVGLALLPAAVGILVVRSLDASRGGALGSGSAFSVGSSTAGASTAGAGSVVSSSAAASPSTANTDPAPSASGSASSTAAPSGPPSSSSAAPQPSATPKIRGSSAPVLPPISAPTAVLTAPNESPKEPIGPAPVYSAPKF